MKRGVVIPVACAAIASVVLAAANQTSEQRIKPDTVVGVVDVSKLSVVEAQKKVRSWWESAKLEPITIVVKGQNLKKTFTAGQLGVTVDDVASIAQLPTEGLIGQMIGDAPSRYPIKYKSVATDFKLLVDEVKKVLGEPGPAKVKFVGGKIQKVPEQPRFEIDLAALPTLIQTAVADDHVLEVKLTEAPKKITDEVLAQIKEVVAEFSTRFSSGNRPRSSNIKLASSKIDGVILLPGETFSYNNTVGRRTVAAGFREAGVYINGRHDVGVGGGICQVSTTLYNAALLANLKIPVRRNHSLPVPYVPVGRDATVDYGSQDLQIVNSMPTAIVLNADYSPGRITFRVLGTKDKSISVKIVSGSVRTWSRGSRRQYDPSIPAGQTRVIERGASGRSVSTWRVVYKNGKEISRESLGQSYYAGSPQIIGYGPARPRVVSRPRVRKSSSPASTAPAVVPSSPPADSGQGNGI